MKALVTGAGGFIGQALVRHLHKEKWSVVALKHHAPARFGSTPGIEEVTGDICDPGSLISAARGCDSVFHLAGKVHALSETSDDLASYEALNVEGTRNVLQAAVAAKAERFVFFSSVKAMGEGQDACLSESCEANPSTAYGQTKLAAENLVLDWGKSFGFHAVCLRLPLVYGPGNKGNLFRMISAIDRGLFPPLAEVGNRRSMVHVTNVITASVLAATSPQANGKRYLVTDAKAYSTNELYQMICRALGKSSPRWHIPRSALAMMGYVGDAIGKVRGKRFVFDSDALDKLIGSAWYSSERIAQELGFSPSVAFQESLPELVAWYRRSNQ